MNQATNTIQQISDGLSRIANSENIQTILEQALDLLGSILPINNGCAVLLQSRHGEPIFAAGYRFDEHEYGSPAMLPIKIWIEQLLRENSADSTQLNQQGQRQIFVLLAAHKRVWGGIYLNIETQTDEDDGIAAAIASLIAKQTALLIENKHMAAELSDSQNARAKFISLVTHELRTPMTAMRGYTDLLRQGTAGPVSDIQLNFLNTILNNIERMSALVSALSDLGRLQTGHLLLNEVPIQLATCVDSAAHSIETYLTEKNQNLIIEIPGNLPMIVADANRVVQVLNVVLTNAHRYSASGTRILLTACQETDSVRVEVHDQGIGMQEHDLERLFEAFFRSEDPAVREYQGWGLGLHVAKQMIELMGGTMGASSIFKSGSIFWFSLPAEQRG